MGIAVAAIVVIIVLAVVAIKVRAARKRKWFNNSASVLDNPLYGMHELGEPSGPVSFATESTLDGAPVAMPVYEETVEAGNSFA